MVTGSNRLGWGERSAVEYAPVVHAQVVRAALHHWDIFEQEAAVGFHRRLPGAL